MNPIQKSMEGIKATEKMKADTLHYLMEYREKKNSPQISRTYRPILTAVCACLFLLLGSLGYIVYQQPVSYISIDVNPSIELGVNRFGRVVSSKAYNDDGENIVSRLSLENITYLQAVEKLLADEAYRRYLTQEAVLVFTVISGSGDKMLKEISATEGYQAYGGQGYLSDMSCMEAAHQHEMSFGKYQAYLELSKYDTDITVEDCHTMTMGEIQIRIQTCQGHTGEGHQESGQGEGESHHHKKGDAH